jgi:WD40 repeat protein
VPTNIGAVAWHPSKQVIAVGKRDGGVWVRDIAEGNELTHAEIGSVGLSFAPDLPWLAIVDADKGLFIWDVSGRAPPKEVDDGAQVAQALFLVSAQSLMTAEKGGRVRLWQTTSPSAGIASLRPIWSVEACPEVEAIATSRDGKLVAAGCEDGRIILWLAATGQVEASIRYPGKVEVLAFVPRGDIVVAGGSAGLHGFFVAREDLVAETCRRLNRNLSLAEWSRNVQGATCHLTCPALPGCD